VNWFKPKDQPKQEHPMQDEWERIPPDEKPQLYHGIEFPLGRSGVVSDHPLLNRPANPDLDIVYGKQYDEEACRDLLYRGVYPGPWLIEDDRVLSQMRLHGYHCEPVRDNSWYYIDMPIDWCGSYELSNGVVIESYGTQLKISERR
jgi:hypothetical protein